MVVVDTHVILWEALQPEKLSKKAGEEFEKANKSSGIIFCDISLWEISMLIAKQRVEIETTYLEFIELLTKTRNYIFQSITPEIADIATNLSQKINSDPADRIIAATAIFLKSSLITVDQNLRMAKPIDTIW